MEWTQIEANWAQFQCIIQHDWDKLTDTQLLMIAGKRDDLINKIQAVYGLSQLQAAAQLSDWQKNQINIDGHFYQTQTSSAKVM